jgi:hypothetical protein
LFVIDGKISTTRVYLFANDSKISSIAIMAWKEQKCKLRRRSNNDRWIIHPEFPMVIRSEFRQAEGVEEENKSQTLDLSAEDQQLSDPV